MPYKTIFIGDSVYEFYKSGVDNRISVTRREFTDRTALGASPPAFSQVVFESEEAFNEQLKQLFPDNMAHA